MSGSAGFARASTCIIQSTMVQKRAEAELLDAVGDYFQHATPGLGAELQAFKSPNGRVASASKPHTSLRQPAPPKALLWYPIIRSDVHRRRSAQGAVP
ncbi:glutathione S-transferase family protein [Roseixanthobacter pseudopolyaromaticivorans]|uniref:hypothetical protein n=1 Tax=Xanthobacteraceae TaxID=335928 RepID=UPI00372CFD6A